MKGKLYLCATPIGNLEDITYRAVRILREVDLIAAEDTRVTIKLLNHFGIKKPMISYFEHNIKEKGKILVKELLDGKNIALVSDAGTPAISDPGEELVRQCIEAGIEVVPIPGAVAAICGLIVSGFGTGRFVFEGFLPAKKGAREERLKALEREERTIIFYEAPHKLRRTLSHMYKLWGDRKIVIARELTKLHEEVLRTSLAEAIALYENAEPKGEIVLLVEGTRAETRDFDDMSLNELVEKHEKEGYPLKEAMRLAAKERGISRRDVYNELKIKRKDEGE